MTTQWLKILDKAGVDLILVGDSLAMVALGHRTTHAVTMEEMLHHTRAVTRGVSNAMVVADLPFMSYQVDVIQAITNAGRFVKEAQAHAVKLRRARPGSILKLSSVWWAWVFRSWVTLVTLPKPFTA
jgi:3-methyl-2-oxobutanoate hydroxymethyltransferase